MKHIQNFWVNNAETDRNGRSNCCGCSACEQMCGKTAISIQPDSEGFVYPKIDLNKCVDCGMCLKVCPVVNKCESTTPYLKTYAGYSTDQEIMEKSTSGGFITTLSRYIIDNGGLVYGVEFDETLTHTHYVVAETYKDLQTLAGSKYVQATKGDTFTQIKAQLKKGRLVLFVGCPCDVSALNRFLLKEYQNLFTCELVCMGVTSPRIAIDYKTWTERKNKSRLVGMNMRSKKKGWFVPHLEEHFANGKKTCRTLFGTYIGYGFQVFNRPSCFVCQYRDTTGVGDVRVGDFWGIKKSDSFWNPQGVSGIYVRSPKGLEILNRLSSYNFRIFETDYILATRSNMSSYKNKPLKYQLLRNKFEKIYITEDRGLETACLRSASLGFWAKRLIPEGLHSTLKRIYHIIIDKKR